MSFAPGIALLDRCQLVAPGNGTRKKAAHHDAAQLAALLDGEGTGRAGDALGRELKGECGLLPVHKKGRGYNIERCSRGGAACCRWEHKEGAHLGL